MEILKLKPAVKDYPWGGRRLADEYGVRLSKSAGHRGKDGAPCLAACASVRIAEAWMLSANDDGPSLVVGGEYDGLTLKEYIDLKGMSVLGENCRRFRELPILTKFIDAKENLSIQVHPDNAYALEHEKKYGKTEMWHILEAEPGAILYYGFKREISLEEFRRRIEENSLIEVLNAVPVQKGDTIFIEAGVIHAIGAGVLVAEIQQNSNVTYRVYDYGRKDAAGKARDLHIEQALAVTRRTPLVKKNTSYPHLADCDYFTVDRVALDGTHTYRMQGAVDDASFLSILVLSGSGVITCRGENLSYQKGDSLFLPARLGDFSIEGSIDALFTTVREKWHPIRLGLAIESAGARVGIVDEEKTLAARNVDFNPTLPPSKIAADLAKDIFDFLKEKDIPLERVVSLGVGFPGTIDSKKGIVLYSNNIRWENVPLKRLLEGFIPCPIHIANNADCAAWGEFIMGAGQGAKSIVMLTIGGGVGSGVIARGKLLGASAGGIEAAHQVVKIGGRRCTCGRRGCLEAYASIPALLRAARVTARRDVPLDEFFALVEAGDKDMCAVFDTYVGNLSQGVVNIVNMFRPELIIIGGRLGSYAKFLIPPLTQAIKAEAFGTASLPLPAIKLAALGQNAGIIGAANL